MSIIWLGMGIVLLVKLNAEMRDRRDGCHEETDKW